MIAVRLEQGIIEPANSLYSGPIILLIEKDWWISLYSRL